MAKIIADKNDLVSIDRDTDEPVYARVRFGSDKSGIFSAVYVDVPVNAAADEEFFGSAKWRGELEDGTVIERAGPAAAFSSKAKHAYEGCRNDAKSLSWLTDAHCRAEIDGKPVPGFPAAYTPAQLAEVQKLFDKYTGPSGKRSPRTVSVAKDALAEAFAKYQTTGDASDLKALGINVNG